MSRQRHTSRTSSRGAAIRLVIGLALCAGMIYTAEQWNAKALRQKQEAIARLADAQQRANTAIADRADLAAYKSSYEQLKQKNILGDEARLPWAEYFNQAAKQTIDSPYLRLTIEPQRLFELTPKQPLGELRFFASRAKLDAGLLHEGSFYRLLDSIKGVAGAHIVQSCALSLSENSSMADGNLKAECELDLLTINKPAEPPAGVAP